MPDYQVLARKYRPQTFQDVLGQEAIVTTLKNAIKRNSIAHAYLFCGSRGTGKTTLARIFAKALNCQNPTENFEPCNCCSSCKEITSGSSFDVLEIDGASHRGIDDIRQINETVGYATASGKYKIYLIDEVHMLTKEAFNALLKTLEEPPPKVIFFFATTEPHKVLPTILSRCQRFNLNRIPLSAIIQKLQRIANDLGVNIQDDALRLLANSAEGGLRDAESLLDQILAFQEGDITLESVTSILGMMPREYFFQLDQAGKENNLAFAFDIAHQIFSQGKDVAHFIEDLIEHFRTILIVKLSGKEAAFLYLSPEEREKYSLSAQLYDQDQCLTILDFLVEARNQRQASSARTVLEALLLRILRSHRRVSVDQLVRRLSELEQKLSSSPQGSSTISNAPPAPPIPLKPIQAAPQKQQLSPALSQPAVSSTTVDPSPSKADLGIKERKAVAAPINNTPTPPAPIELGARPTPEAKQVSLQQQSHYDTIMQFAAIELEGTLQKKAFNRT